MWKKVSKWWEFSIYLLTDFSPHYAAIWMLIVRNRCKCRCNDGECIKHLALFFGMSRGSCKFPFQNLSKFAKIGCELIRQVNATARQKWWNRNKVWFLFDIRKIYINKFVELWKIKINTFYKNILDVCLC